MPKPPSSCLGIEIGHFSLKAVLLARKGKKLAVTAYAHLPVDGEMRTGKELASHLARLLKRVGAKAPFTAFSISSKEALIKLIDQPETPPDLLRDAIALNPKRFLNQELNGYTVDCSLVAPAGPRPGADPSAPPEAVSPAKARERRYLATGLPSGVVQMVWDATRELKLKHQAVNLQISPISIVNAFESAQPEIFSQGSCLLVDIGHLETTVSAICRGELIITRSVEFSGQGLVNFIATNSGIEPPAALELVQHGDAAAFQTAEPYINTLAREIGSSISFFEGQRDETPQKVYISGGVAASQPFLQQLVGYIDVTCELWNPLENCDIQVPRKIREAFDADFINLASATGAAVSTLHVPPAPPKPAKKAAAPKDAAK